MKTIIILVNLIISFSSFASVCPNLSGIYNACYVTQDLLVMGGPVLLRPNNVEIGAPETISISQGTTPSGIGVVNLMTVTSIDTYVLDGQKRSASSIGIDGIQTGDENQSIEVIAFCAEDKFNIKFSSHRDDRHDVSWEYEDTTRFSKTDNKLIVELDNEKVFIVCSEVLN